MFSLDEIKDKIEKRTKKLIPDKDPFIPEACLVLYKHSNTSYMETHKFVNGKMGAGKPVSTDFVKSLYHACKDTKINMNSLDGIQIGFIPNNLLHLEVAPFKTVVIWTTPSHRRTLHFLIGNKVTELKDCLIPALVWNYNVSECSLKVFGGSINRLKTTDLSKVELPIAPFSNISNNGGVCLGSTTLPKKATTIIDVMRGVEDGFFNSRFTDEANSTISMWEHLQRNASTINANNKVLRKMFKFPTKKVNIL